MGGGSEQALLNLLAHNSSANNEIEIDVLVLLKGGILESRLKEKAFENYKFSYVTGNRIIFKLLFILCNYHFAARLLAGLLIKGSYDIGICYEESRWSALIAWSGKIAKKISWFHCMVTTQPGFRKINQNQKALQRYKNKHKEFHKRVFVSQASKKSFETLTGITENNSVIYNIVDYKRILHLSQYEIVSPFKSTTKTGLRIIMVGNLYDVKNYPFALEVFKLLKDKEIPFEVIILGKGDNYHNLKRFIELHELQEYVSLLGYVENPYPYILQSDLYFSTSISEARPTAVIEALCLKKPYIVPSISAYEEIHQQYNAGLLYKTSSVEKAANAIIQLYSDKTLRENLIVEMERINWKDIGNEYIELFY